MACTSSCPNPGTHESWGECLKAKSLHIAAVNSTSNGHSHGGSK
jgi:hypothetical protein